MSIARLPATLWVAPLLLLAVLAGPARWQPVARGADPVAGQAVVRARALEDELARQRAQLADLQREQAELTRGLRDLAIEIGKVGLQIDVAQQRLLGLTRRLSELQDTLRRSTTDIWSLSASLEGVSDEITTSESELAGREALLQEHLRTAYEQSRSSILEVLLSTDSFTTASTQLSAVLSLTDEDRQLVTEIVERRSALEQRRASLALGRDSIPALRLLAGARADALTAQGFLLEEVRVALQVKLDQLATLRNAHDEPLPGASANVDQQAAQIAARQLLLEGQRALVERMRIAAAALDVVYRGRFAWPVRGDFLVTQEFGPTAFDPSHPGLDVAYVAAGCGGPVYAAADGIVLRDGRPLARSGDSAIAVILGHSRRLQTWYWHLAREVVSVGQQVHAGDVIGYEGMTGLASGCLLHFGVNFDDQPVNPRLYLP